MPEEIQVSQELQRLLTDASVLASINRNKLVTPEHILLTALNDGKVRSALTYVTTDLLINDVIEKLRERIDGMESIPEDDPEPVITFSYQYEQLMAALVLLCRNAQIGTADVYHLIHEMMDLKDSYAANCLHLLVSDEDKGDFFEALGEFYLDTPNDQHEPRADDVDKINCESRCAGNTFSALEFQHYRKVVSKYCTSRRISNIQNDVLRISLSKQKISYENSCHAFKHISQENYSSRLRPHNSQCIGSTCVSASYASDINTF